MNDRSADKQRNLAAEVYGALVPKHLPQPAGYEFFASCEPAESVGGDFYDCLILPEDKVCFTFGDVAGKGVAAAMVMSKLSGVVRTTLEFVQEARDAVSRINSHMCENAAEGRFVTLVLGIIDLRSHELSLVLAGHMSPMIRKVDGTVEEFPESAAGLPVGIVDGLNFEEFRRVIEPGDSICLYTDGICDAMNSSRTVYALDRLRETVGMSSPRPSLLGPAILDDVRRHIGDERQSDDMTVMVIGRKPLVSASS